MSEERLELRAPARPEEIGRLRRTIDAFARGHGAAGELAEAVRLSVSEALTNVVLHAYRDQREPGEVTAVAELAGRQLVIVVCDEGLGPRPRPDTPGLGLGIGLMAEMADDFVIASRHDQPGTIVSLRFDLVTRMAAVA